MEITLSDQTVEPYAVVLQVTAGTVAISAGLSIDELDALILDLTAARHEWLEGHPDPVLLAGA